MGVPLQSADPSCPFFIRRLTTHSSCLLRVAVVWCQLAPKWSGGIPGSMTHSPAPYRLRVHALILIPAQQQLMGTISLLPCLHVLFCPPMCEVWSRSSGKARVLVRAPGAFRLGNLEVLFVTQIRLNCTILDAIGR
ncbi:hypothetical protein BS78_08G167500 [Paspalum vaginatum]|nr:hypothetical protein BS78_08G167500 [Paspalum vaginatum]